MNTKRAVLLISVLVCGLPGCKKTSAARGQAGSATSATGVAVAVDSNGFPVLPPPDNPSMDPGKVLQTIQEAATKPAVEVRAPYGVSRAMNGTCGKKGNFAEAPKIGPLCYRACKTKADCPPEATCDAAPTKNGKKLCFGHWGGENNAADAGGW